MKEELKIYKRNCPICGKEIIHKSIYDGKKADKIKRRCRDCSNKARVGYKHTEETIKIIKEKRANQVFSNETRQKMSKSQMGHTVSEETRLKIATALTGGKLSEEAIQNISKALKGVKQTDQAIAARSKALIGHIVTEATRNKISESESGKIVSEESKQKIRASARKRILDHLGICFPNYNPIACQYFNQLMEQTRTHIQHAENGGEFYIKDLGYWVDGYDKENNIFYEYDEPRHFNSDGTLKEKDIKRQKEIEKYYPEYKFIRIKQK